MTSIGPVVSKVTIVHRRQRHHLRSPHPLRTIKTGKFHWHVVVFVSNCCFSLSTLQFYDRASSRKIAALGTRFPGNFAIYSQSAPWQHDPSSLEFPADVNEAVRLLLPTPVKRPVQGGCAEGFFIVQQSLPRINVNLFIVCVTPLALANVIAFVSFSSNKT